MKIIDCKQGSEAWMLARCGIPTASEFDNLVTPEWKIRTGQMPESYLLKKVAERVMGHPMLSFSGGAMEQGSILESEGLPWFELVYGIPINRVGFCTTDDGRVGASPDSLIGEDSGLELKCPEPHTHIKYLLGGVVPSDYVAQVQGCLFVTGRKTWRFVSYSRYFPPLVLTVERDPVAQDAIANALRLFLAEYDTAFAKISALMPQSNGREAK